MTKFLAIIFFFSLHGISPSIEKLKPGLPEPEPLKQYVVKPNDRIIIKNAVCIEILPEFPNNYFCTSAQ